MSFLAAVGLGTRMRYFCWGSPRARGFMMRRALSGENLSRCTSGKTRGTAWSLQSTQFVKLIELSCASIIQPVRTRTRQRPPNCNPQLDKLQWESGKNRRVYAHCFLNYTHGYEREFDELSKPHDALPGFIWSPAAASILTRRGFTIGSCRFGVSETILNDR
jgi:hypothetical protein